MAKLILYLDNAILSEFFLKKELTTIGRRPNNVIHMDNLAVSGEHAVVVKKGNDFYVEDLGSTNGTTVNGQEIKNHLLRHGDVVEIGKYQLKFIDEEVLSHIGTEQAEHAGFEKTVMVHTSALQALERQAKETANLAFDTTASLEQSHTEAVAPVAAIASPTVGKVQVLNGPSAGRELVLNKALTTLGKVGVQVAVITKRANGYFITHVEGKTYPLVNEVSTGAQAFALNDQDVIEIAGVKMAFYLDAA